MSEAEQMTGPVWNRSFREIGIWMDHGAVHVKNDKALKVFMGLHYREALQLAKHLKKTYKKQYGKVLRISSRSLAIELLGHYFLQEMTFRSQDILRKIPGCSRFLGFCEWMLRHMDVIDCGEKEGDNNRFLWDLLALPVEVWDKMRKNR